MVTANELGRTQANRYVVQPVARALEVLVYVAERGHDVSLSEVAAALRMPKTTTFRYLQTLVAASFLTNERSSDRYRIGHRFRALARFDTSIQGLRAMALPPMRALLERFNETVNLAILSEGHIVYVEMLEAQRTLRMQARIGDRHPVHSTALGKAMLAFLSGEEVERHLGQALVEKTIRTTTDRRALLRQLGKVRRDAYAMESGENEDGAMCIGVPIFDEHGRPAAALSLSLPERRATPAVQAPMIEALHEAARRVSEELGHAPHRRG